MKIRPIGEQIIIRTLPPDAVGSIIIPDAAKSITKIGKEDPTSAINFVEAEVIAVGPGKRGHDEAFMPDVIGVLEGTLRLTITLPKTRTPDVARLSSVIAAILERARNQTRRQTPLVKPGDRILYHPAVQTFDRDITAIVQPALEDGSPLNGSKYFIIREGSVLAILDPPEKTP